MLYSRALSCQAVCVTDVNSSYPPGGSSDLGD